MLVLLLCIILIPFGYYFDIIIAISTLMSILTFILISF
jgi:hypothetical protein